MTTPNLSLSEMDTNLLQPSVPFNAAMRTLDATVQLAVQTITNTPPTTTSGDVGKRWIIGASPTGPWGPHAGKIALCIDAGLWDYFVPKAGWFARDITAGVWREYTGSAWAQRDASTDSASSGVITGLGLEWVSATSLRVTTGAAHIESLGRAISATSAITKSSLSLSASTWYYVYLFENAGAADIEIVTTAPATAYRGTARSKSGDTSRRFLGAVRTDGSGNLYEFMTEANETIWIVNATQTPFRVLAGGTTTAWTSFSLASVVPPTAKQFSALMQVVGGTIGTDISSDSAGGKFRYTINPSQGFPKYYPMTTAQTFYYKAPASGAGALYVDVMGFTLER